MSSPEPHRDQLASSHLVVLVFLDHARCLRPGQNVATAMANDPVLIAYTVKDRAEGQKSIWRRIGVAFPHDNGAGLTVLLDALPIDGRIVLVEPKIDPDQFAGLPACATRAAQTAPLTEFRWRSTCP